jgi:hypothetical protein
MTASGNGTETAGHPVSETEKMYEAGPERTVAYRAWNADFLKNPTPTSQESYHVSALPK